MGRQPPFGGLVARDQQLQPHMLGNHTIDVIALVQVHQIDELPGLLVTGHARQVLNPVARAVQEDRQMRDEARIILSRDKLPGSGYKLKWIAEVLPMLYGLKRIASNTTDQITPLERPVMAVPPSSFLARSIGNADLKPVRAVSDGLPIPELEETPNAILTGDIEVREGIEPAPEVDVVGGPEGLAREGSSQVHIVA